MNSTGTKRQFKSSGRSPIVLLLAMWITFFGVFTKAAERSSADPKKLVPRREAKVRCEVIFTDFARFVGTRQRILLTPLSDPALEARFNQWMGQLNAVLKLPDLIRADFDEMGRAIDQLSPAEKTALVNEVAAIYTEATAEKYRAVKMKEFKRTLDLILSRTGRPDILFKKIESDSRAWAAYKDYFKNTRKNAGLTEDYSPQEVWDLLFWVKQKLAKEEKSNPSLGGAEIIIYGSYINGRAILKSSDIDAIANNQKTSAFVDRLNEDPYFKKYQVDHIAANSGTKFSEWSAAQLSPILFVVNAEHILMKVYNPMSYSEISTKRPKERARIYILY